MSKNPILCFPIFLRCFLFIVFLAGCSPSPQISRKDEIKDGQQKGESVIKAIEQYYLYNDKYPSKIESLIPKYLNEIPFTNSGNPILYELTDNGYIVEFGLKTRGNVKSTCIFNNRLPIWDCSFYINEN